MKYLILGAGPAGLAFANRLLENGEEDFLILEKEAEAGGLCRSQMIDEHPLDVGGGHFIDVTNPKVLEMLFRVMPKEEWNSFDRNSKIDLNGEMINSPLESNIWQLSIDKQVGYLKSIAVAGCNLREPIPERFIDWIYWKLGEKVAEDYMIPYNQKMFGSDLNDLGTYWLNKLPNVSFDETLISCLTKKAYGTQPGHTNFFYPKKYGSGEVWKRLANKLDNKIKYNITIETLDIDSHLINDEYVGKYIINTIPWSEFKRTKGIDDYYKNIIKQLKYSSVVIEYYPNNLDTNAHWIYCPNRELAYHRTLVRHNFCENSRGYWTETNYERFEKKNAEFSYINKYAYPLNTIEKPHIMKELLSFMKDKEVVGLGRWGEWEHYNSDVVVSKAIDLADEFI